MKPSGSTRLTIGSLTFIQRNKVLKLRSVWQAGSISISTKPSAEPFASVDLDPSSGRAPAEQGVGPGGDRAHAVVADREACRFPAGSLLPAAWNSLMTPRRGTRISMYEVEYSLTRSRLCRGSP